MLPPRRDSKPSLEGRTLLPNSRVASGEVAFACLHERLVWDRKPTPFFVVAFVDGAVFLSRRQPPLYDAERKRIREPIEIGPGSIVRVLYHDRDGGKWIDAVQVIRLEDEVPDFGPADPSQ